MRTLKISSALSLVLLLLVINVLPAAAIQMLPAAPWYAVAWIKSNDTLHWLNASGEQAVIPRPHLPNEAAPAPETPPQMKISPNGRYLVLVTKLNNSREGLGIFDLQMGTFVKTHEAQPGESINLGGKLTFTADSRFFAAGFVSGDFANPGWRIITFNTETGDAGEVLNHTDPNVPAVSGLVLPYIVYYAVNLDAEQEDIHFQMIPQGTGGMDEVQAFVWSPLFGQVNPSPYTRTGQDILPLTGEIAYAVVANGYPVLPPNGPFNSFNAIARQKPGQAAQIVAINGEFYHWSPRWAKNGEWLLYQTSNEGGVMNWNNTETTGSPDNNSTFPFDSSIVSAFGTGDGFIFYDTNHRVSYTNGFTPMTAPVIYQAPEAPEIIYVTPQGMSFTLSSVGDLVIIGNPPQVVPPATGCGTAPAPRMTVGSPGRVTFTDGTKLRVRQVPGGSIVTQLPEGTTFTVIGGPQCQSNFNWWQIQMVAGLTGWVAEGDTQDYFIEPWGALNQQPTLPVAAVITPTAVLVVSDANCSLAPVQTVAVGAVLKTVSPGGTLSLRQNPADATPFAQVADGVPVTVVQGPVCHQGYRLWRVNVSINGQATSGWLSEGTQQTYYLKP